MVYVKARVCAEFNKLEFTHIQALVHTCLTNLKTEVTLCRKTHQMFSVNATPGEFKEEQSWSFYMCV